MDLIIKIWNIVMGNVFLTILSFLFFYKLYIFLLVHFKIGKDFRTVPKLDKISIHQYGLMVIFIIVFTGLSFFGKNKDITFSLLPLSIAFLLYMQSKLLGSKWINDQAIMYYSNDFILIYPTIFKRFAFNFKMAKWKDIDKFSYKIYTFTRITGKVKEIIMGEILLKSGKTIDFKIYQNNFNMFIDTFKQFGKYNG